MSFLDLKIRLNYFPPFCLDRKIRDNQHDKVALIHGTDKVEYTKALHLPSEEITTCSSSSGKQSGKVKLLS